MALGRSGYEEFLWMGQLRYRCNRKWPDGSRCDYDTYDLGVMHDHEKTIHGPREPVPEPSMLFDADGKKIKTAAQPEPDVPPAFQNYRIKK